MPRLAAVRRTARFSEPRLNQAPRPEPSNMSNAADASLLGRVVPDAAPATNERVVIRTSYHQRQRVMRNQFVTITDALSPQTMFLGRLVCGPFFPGSAGDNNEIRAEVEVQGEL